jgi:hypothetical protein
MLLQTFKKYLPFEVQKKIADTFAHISMHYEIRDANSGKLEKQGMCHSFTANFAQALFVLFGGVSFTQSAITNYNTANKFVKIDGTINSANPMSFDSLKLNAPSGNTDKGIVLSKLSTLPISPLSQIDTTDIIQNGTGVDQLVYSSQDGVGISIVGNQTQFSVFRTITNQSLLPIAANRFYFKSNLTTATYIYFLIEDIAGTIFEVGQAKTITVFTTITT